MHPCMATALAWNFSFGSGTPSSRHRSVTISCALASSTAISSSMSSRLEFDENWSTRAQCLRVGPAVMRCVAIGIDMTPRYRSHVTFLDDRSGGPDQSRSHRDLGHTALDGTPDPPGIQSVQP